MKYEKDNDEKKQDEDGGVGEELCTGGVVAKSR